MEIIELAGLQIDKENNIVLNGTTPVKERYYHSSRLHESISCYDSHLKLFQNVELFQPVIYDLDNPIPKYNRMWEVYDNPNIKKKNLVRINYPKYYLEWWYEQRRRCLEGYEVGGVYISGPFYFYLNFWKIKVKERGGGLQPPKFLDLDKQFFDLIEQARAENKNLLAVKRRQIGFTEKLSCLSGYEALFFPNSQSLIVAGEEKYAQNAFDKMKMGIDSLSPDSQESAGREFYKRSLKNIPEYIRFGFSSNGVDKGYLSEVFSITTKDNAQAASGKSPTLVFLEEAGINPLLERVYNMILPSIQERGRQNGRIIIIVGTGGEMKKGVAALMKMFYNPDKFNLLSVPNTFEEGLPEGARCCPFFPAYLYLITDHDGNSYKEAGIEWTMMDRKKCKGDKKALHDSKTQFPLTPREAFSVSGLSPFNTDKLDSQLQKLMSIDMTEKEQWGRFDEIMEDGRLVGVRWVPAPSGMEEAVDSEGDFKYPCLVLEHPERPDYEDEAHFEYRLGMASYSNLYGAGTDSYDKDEANTSDSEGSMVIQKGYKDANSTSMLPVFRLTWRPVKKEKFYRQTALACYYYGECENLIEWSNIAIFDYYKNNDFEHLLKERPEISYATVKDSKVNNRYGVDPNTKSVWIEHYAAYVEDYSDNIYDQVMVQRLMSFRNNRDYNCDITISAMLAYECILDDLKRGQSTTKTENRGKGRPMMGFIKQGNKIYRI